jgi:sterol 24-C-methyltransferase
MVSGWFGTKNVSKDAHEYADFFDASKGGNVEKRNKEYMTMVNHYYNLVTDFYEYGWGYSFHFGRRFKGEDFHASLARHEQWLAARANFGPGQTILDLGCGVGGPMRCIARFTGSKIIGINNNAYQITRGTKQVAEAGLSDLCSFKQCDFMHLDFKDNTIDGAYAIEATCHAPDKAACFAEILRVLKPGATFTGYEWVMTDKWDPKNKTHAQIKHGIEVGDSLPDLPLHTEVPRALKAAGFEVIECKDVAPLDGPNNMSWYATIENTGFGFKNFKSSKIGIWLTHQMVRVLEFVRLAPAGTVKTHEWLSSAIGPLAAGGQTGIFTPMYYFKAVKPKK